METTEEEREEEKEEKKIPPTPLPIYEARFLYLVIQKYSRNIEELSSHNGSKSTQIQSKLIRKTRQNAVQILLKL